MRRWYERLKKSGFFAIVFAALFATTLFATSVPLDPEKPSIVFVHIGERFPDYLKVAVKQARLFNSCNIIVVANECAVEAHNMENEVLDAACIPCESLAKSEAHLAFLKNSQIDRSFRDGFWSHATERFLYLHDLLTQYGLRHVVHLETDNLLYVDICSLIPIFEKHYQQIGLTFDNNERCIPGFVYIREPHNLDKLAQHIAQNSVSGTHDMKLLYDYYKLYGESFAQPLPVIMSAYVAVNELVSPFGHRPNDPSKFCIHDDEFLSIFDAAAIGQYLGGIDPRNGPSQPGFINERCVFNPALLSYTWKKDEAGRLVPFAGYLGMERRINNLHVHSKNLAQFFSIQENQ